MPSVGTYPALVRKLTERFETTLDDGGLRPVLVLDEAHELRPDVLSMLRLLTNFKMDSRLVLSIVLSGQPPLGTLLRRDDQEAIARRLVYYATLRTLSDAETRAYVEHRCAIAGAARSPFDSASVDALYEMSRGNLRAIDCLALEALGIAARAKADRRLRRPHRRRPKGALAVSASTPAAPELPVARAADLEVASAEHQWLVRQIWTQQAVGIVGGVPKSCKSWFGLDLAVSVASAHSLSRPLRRRRSRHRARLPRRGRAAPGPWPHRRLVPAPWPSPRGARPARDHRAQPAPRPRRRPGTSAHHRRSPQAQAARARSPGETSPAGREQQRRRLRAARLPARAASESTRSPSSSSIT